MPSELAAFSYNFLVAKYIEYYRDASLKHGKTGKTLQNIPKEKWCYPRNNKRGYSDNNIKTDEVFGTESIPLNESDFFNDVFTFGMIKLMRICLFISLNNLLIFKDMNGYQEIKSCL